MKLIVGLGNFGEKYRDTRHNAGFLAVEKLAERLGLSWEAAGFGKALVTKNNEVVLLKPLTYMNLSGEAVSAAARFYKIEAADVWVVADDLYVEAGKLRVRLDGQAGGHNGLRSVISAIGNGFWRWRVGVGPQPERIPAEDFVLAKLKGEGLKQFGEIAEGVAEKLERDLREGAKEETVSLI